MSKQKFSWPAYLAGAAAMVGLAGALFLGGLRVVNSEGPLAQAEWAGNLAFTLVYLAPFLLSLLALRWPAVWRAATWAAAATLAGLGIFTAFSGVAFVLLPAALLLAPAALAAFARTSPRRWPVAILTGAVLVALVSGAWLGLIAGGDDGRCWNLVRGPEGETEWQEVPYGQSGTITATITGDEPGIVRTMCTSDVITTAEAGLALLLLTVAALFIAGLVRRWPEPQADPNGERLLSDGV